MYTYKKQLINNYTKDFKTSVKVPKSITAYFFIVGQLMFGFNFGFTRSFKNAKWVKNVLFIIPLFYIFYSFYIITGDQSIFYWKFLYPIQYFFYVFTLILTKHSVYDFIIDISALDGGDVKNFSKFGVVIFIYTLATFIFKMSLCVFACLYYEDWCVNFDWLSYMVFIPSLAIEMFPVVLTLIVYLILTRIKYMKYYISDFRSDVANMQNYYMSLSDCYDKIKPFYARIIVLELVLDSPKLLVMMWKALHFVQLNSDFMIYLSWFIYVVHIVIQICIPAIVAEMINTEMDEIKIILNKQIMIQPDEKRNLQMTHLCNFMNCKPLNHVVGNVIPVDMRLPVSLFGLYTTYFIVVIQFTHLYD